MRRNTRNTLRERIVLPISAIACIVGGTGLPTRAAPGDMYELGTLNGVTSQGLSINNAGQVAGRSTIPGGTSHAFRYVGLPGAGGTMQDVGTFDGHGHGAGINASGQVTGWADTNHNNLFHAFRYTGTPGAGGAMADLQTLGGTNSQGLAINDSGQVTGLSDRAANGTAHAFRYTGTPGAGGAMVDLGTLGGSGSTGTGINNAGQVTGRADLLGDSVIHAFRSTGTTMADLGTLGGFYASGLAINNAGQVAGESYLDDNDTTHAFRYTGTPGAGGKMVDLPSLPNGKNAHGYAINSAGFIVGGADVDFAGSVVPALWQIDAANTVINLDAWLDAMNPTTGAKWRLKEAHGINDNGLITGWGTYDPGGGAGVSTRAFILDASSLVPEPTTALAPLLAVAALLRRRGTRAAGIGSEKRASRHPEECG